MKKNGILIVLFIFLSLSNVFSQDISGFSGIDSSSKRINFFNPIIWGNGIVNNYIVNSGPYQLLTDTTVVHNDSIGSFDLDSIPSQIVLYNNPCTFYITSKSLIQSGKAIAGVNWVVTQGTPLGVASINRLQQFSYITTTDTLDFYLQFTAYDSNGDSIKSNNPVHFHVVPSLPYESSVFGIPNSFNNISNGTDSEFVVKYFDSTSKTLSYSGVKVIMDTIAGNDFSAYNFKDTSLRTLNIYAETLIINAPMTFPGTNVNIYARDLIFMDGLKSGANSNINTTGMKYAFALISGGGKGSHGLNAGNISLHILKFTANPGIRFILNGGDGQIAADTSGVGGKGGILSSTVDVSKFYISIGGYSGNGNVSPYRGGNGSYSTDLNYARWLHPNYLHLVENYYKEAFYAGNTTQVINTLMPYQDTLINWFNNGTINQIKTDSSDNYNQLKQITAEMQQVFYNIGNNLDYFGNPPGWVPMLSFEISYGAYQNEINEALNVMLLDQIVQAAYTSVTQKANAIQQQMQNAVQEVTTNQATYNNIAFTVIPDIKQKMRNNQASLDSLQSVLTSISNQLTQQAQSIYNSQHNVWGEALGVAIDVCAMIPTPITEGIALVGDGMVDVLGGNFVTSIKNGQGIVNKVTGGLAPLISLATGNIADDVSSLGTDINGGISGIGDDVSTLVGDASNGAFTDAIQAGYNVATDVNNVVSSVQGLYKSTVGLMDSVTNSYKGVVNVYNSLVNIGSDQLSSIKGQLIANDPQIGQIAEDMQNLENVQQQLSQELTQSCQQLLVSENAINSGLTSISHLSNAAVIANNPWDYSISVYSKDLRRKAFERLRKYYYYLGKAWEYRTLKPFTGLLNLDQIVKEMSNLVDSIRGSSQITATSFTSQLASVYQSTLQDLADSIYSFYEANAPSHTITSTYRLTASEIAALNKGQSVNLNLVKDAVFRPTEEDLRIVGLSVSKIVTEPINNSNIGNYDQLDFTFNYPNYSRIKKNGVIYNFNNYNLNTQYPIFWSTRYDFNSQAMTNSYTSVSASSMLKTLLAPNATSDMSIYSEPAAWADISLSMDHYSNSSNQVIIDTIEVQVQYDYTPEPNNQVHIELNTNNKWFAPTFQISTFDINNNKSGIGNVHRAYTKSSGNFVSITAPKIYGQYIFTNWADRTGTPVVPSSDINISQGNTITISQANDQYLQAVYKFNGPVFNMPDTIYLGDSTKYKLIFTNSGIGNLYWSLDSMSNWISYAGKKTGINDSTLLFNFQTLPDTLTYRIGKIDLTSTFTESINNYVYFVQGNKLSNPTSTTTTPTSPDSTIVIPSPPDSIKMIYPNPVRSTYLNIAFANPLLNDATVSILNLNGDFVLSAKLIAGIQIYELDLSRLMNGNYYIKIQDNAGLSVVKEFIISR